MEEHLARRAVTSDNPSTELNERNREPRALAVLFLALTCSSHAIAPNSRIGRRSKAHLDEQNVAHELDVRLERQQIGFETGEGV